MRAEALRWCLFSFFFLFFSFFSGKRAESKRGRVKTKKKKKKGQEEKRCYFFFLVCLFVRFTDPKKKREKKRQCFVEIHAATHATVELNSLGSARLSKKKKKLF